MAESGFDMIPGLPPATPQSAGPSAAATPAGTNGQPSAKGSDGLGFGDILSALNPLQYLPVVGTIYRAATGDAISPTLRIAGSFVSGLFSGGIGAIATIGGAVVEELFHLATSKPDTDAKPETNAKPDASALAPRTASPNAAPHIPTLPPLPGAQTITLAPPTEATPAAAAAAYRNVASFALG